MAAVGQWDKAGGSPPRAVQKNAGPAPAFFFNRTRRMGRAKRLSTAKLVNPSSRAGHEASKAGAVSCPQIRPGPCHVVELLPAAARRRRRAGARRGGGGGQGQIGRAHV